MRFLMKNQSLSCLRLYFLPQITKQVINSLPTVILRAFSGSDQNVITERLSEIVVINLNRPEKRNSVNHSTSLELAAAIENFEKDDKLKIAILYGKGGNFCAGYDLSEFGSNSKDIQNVLENCSNDDQGNGAMGPSRRYFKKPVIAAIEGYAVAGGLELACMCDLRVLDESAILGVFCRRFGIPLIDGGAVRLPKLIGLSRALDLIITGRPIDAKEAFAIGLANRVVVRGSALGTAVQMANIIARYPQKCLNVDRQSAYYSSYDATDFKDAVKHELKNGMEIIAEESIPGAASFVKGAGRHGKFTENEDK